MDTWRYGYCSMSTASTAVAASTITELPMEVRDYYSKWKTDDEFPPARFDVAAALKGKEFLLTAEQWLFAARVADNAGDFSFAGKAYYTAFHGDLKLRSSDEYEDLDAICVATITKDLKTVLAAPSGAADIAAALNCADVDDDDHIHAEPPPKRARKAEFEGKTAPPKRRWRDVAAYVFNRLRTGDKAYPIRVQEALFWASAQWVRLHGYTLFSDTCFVNWKFGPASHEVWEAVRNEWSTTADRDDSAVQGDDELTAVLDAAIAHVHRRTWDDISDESHMERLWFCTQGGAVFSEEDMIETYRDDPTGKLAAIFDGEASSQVACSPHVEASVTAVMKSKALHGAGRG